MWIALGIVVLLLVATIIYLATLDGNYRVRQSLTIEAPLENVFAAIVDFKSWPRWSPWLMHEPEAEIVYSENYQAVDGFYNWDGKVVGAGKLTHLNFNPGKSINQQIEFIRPFKSVNEVNWYFESNENGTKVSWEMIGCMPFLFRFMADSIEPMIGRDYDLGLALLNGYLNADASHPEISFGAVETLDDFSYWAIPFSGNLRDLETARKNNIAALMEAAEGKTGLALSLFNRLDQMASQYEAEIAIPIAEDRPKSNYTRREFSGGRYFRMTLGGDHKFLALGWYALHSHCRMHKIKIDKTRVSLEIYLNDPAETEDPNQISTALYIPVK